MQTIAYTSYDVDIDPRVFPRSSKSNEKNPGIDSTERSVPVDVKSSRQLLERLRKIVESEMEIRTTKELISRRAFT